MNGFSAADMTTAAQEAVAWIKTKPTAEGAYYVRGFNLFQIAQYEALVQVRMHHFDGEPAPELVCNIHESTSNEDMGEWSPMVDMSDDFEWFGPLYAAPVAEAPVDVIAGVLSDLSAVAGSWTVEAVGAGADARNDCAVQMLEAIEQQSIKFGLFDASTPAAPVDLHAHLLHMLGAKDHEDAGRIIGELHASSMSTPAAPGIDLTNCLQHTHAVIDKMQDVMAVHGFAVPVRVISDAFRTTLLCQQDGLIDASPKGDHVVGVNKMVQDSPKGGSAAWQPMDVAPKSVADGERVEGIYLLGYIPDADLVDPQAYIDVIWWEPLLPNSKGERGKWCANRYGEACEVAPTGWQHLPAAQATSAEGGS